MVRKTARIKSQKNWPLVANVRTWQIFPDCGRLLWTALSYKPVTLVDMSRFRRTKKLI